MDITQLILDDHHEQRRLFAILEQIDRSDTETLGAVWDRLAAFLELHAAAEEEIFYPALLRVGIAARRGGTAEDETLDAIGDHNDIRDAVVSAAGHPVGSDEWFAAVAAANLANSDHMAEEEREGLTDFRRLASLQLRHDLAVRVRGVRGQALRRGPAGGQGPAGLRPRGRGAAGPAGRGAAGRRAAMAGRSASAASSRPGQRRPDGVPDGSAGHRQPQGSFRDPPR